MSIPDGAPFCIREVWSFNLHSEFELIRSVLAFYPYVSIDTEFPGVVLKPNPSPPSFTDQIHSSKQAAQQNHQQQHNRNMKKNNNYHTMASSYNNNYGTPLFNNNNSNNNYNNNSNNSRDYDATYRTMKVNVDKMKLIQVGLTFMDEDGILPVLSDGTYCAWQFNFRGFDPDEDIYHPSSIALLRRCGIDFNKNQLFGVDSAQFRELLLSCGLLFNRNVRYICFHGAYDFAYLLKLITRECLPPDEEGFLGLLKHYFGTFYDLKYMQIHLNMHGGLEKLARTLGIKRIGPSHQAGSDSLLTSSSFQRMKDLYFLDHCNDYSGVLFGLALPKAKVVY